MKILYHHRIGSKDGQYVHVREMIDALERLGHQVVVVGPRAFNAQSFGGQSHSVAWLKRFLPKPVYEILELSYSLRDYWHLRAAIRAHRPDCIYERYNLYFISGVLAQKRQHLPLIVEVNAPIMDERAKYGGLSMKALARWSERLVWRNADHVFTVTAVLARRIVAETGSLEHISVTPNGVDMVRFDCLPTRAEAKARRGWGGGIVLGFTGFVRRWHGLERVIDLMADRRDLAVRFAVVGDGPARSFLEDRAATAGVDDQVTFCGLVLQEQIPTYVAAFDIAVQPSVVPYASPLKLFEYMAAACAIVAPDTENIREILQHESNALLFSMDDPASLARQVQRLVDDAALRQKLGAAARRTLETRGLTWEHNARAVLAVAERLAGRETRRTGPTPDRRLPREPSP